MTSALRSRSALLALLAVLVLAFAVACGGGDDDDGADTGAAGDTGTTQNETGTTGDTGAMGPAIRVGLVTDVGGLDDRSFNFLANQGLERAQDQLGAEGRVVISRSNSDYVPNLSRLAQQDYDLIIAVGFLMAESVTTVATQFPDVNFAIVDFPNAALEGTPANVRGLLFKEQEAGYLAGYLAGLMNKQESGSKQVIGSVGGQKIPPVDRYIAGYQAGAKAANPEIQTLNGYSQDFVDQAKCKEVALDQISRGADVIFQVAGQCGLGALSAAQEKNVRGIGVDADQGYLGEHILTSALKKVDVAVFQAIQQVQEGNFKGGEDTVFDIASGGVGLGEIADDVPGDIVSQVKDVQDRIAAGEIDIPETIG
ncbi:MAG TPA: BMP family ABC transporter substrate-binding protein [Gaiellaceae bacterium]|nr:BMP family ABC transporter substrate-binding protein [Gaiellaceae bacterium]